MPVCVNINSCDVIAAARPGLCCATNRQLVSMDRHNPPLLQRAVSGADGRFGRVLAGLGAPAGERQRSGGGARAKAPSLNLRARGGPGRALPIGRLGAGASPNRRPTQPLATTWAGKDRGQGRGQGQWARVVSQCNTPANQPTALHDDRTASINCTSDCMLAAAPAAILSLILVSGRRPRSLFGSFVYVSACPRSPRGGTRRRTQGVTTRTRLPVWAQGLASSAFLFAWASHGGRALLFVCCMYIW